MSETMTISAASITAISPHARAGYMAHIKKIFISWFQMVSSPAHHGNRVSGQKKASAAASP